METSIGKSEIGQKLSALRKRKGFSQAELAESTGISRPSLVQIENGRRGIDILELQRFSKVLGFSLDEFMSNELATQHDIDDNSKEGKIKKEERVSVPVFNAVKFRNVLLYILERCAGKSNFGETVLYKVLYFSDFNYYELYEEHLTGATYRKLPFGPVPKKADNLVRKMTDQGVLQRIKTEYHGYPQTRYLPLVRADLSLMKASEKEVIDRVIEQMSDWSAAAISNYSHKDIPWLASREGDDISYELVFYRDAPFSARNYGDEIEER
ncbi:MAG: type II toxin-antitoxin system antitoxin SocA domain-containing protein [Bacteroidota bacterium]